MWPAFLFLLLLRFALGAPVDSSGNLNNGPPKLTPEEFRSMKGTYFIIFFSPYCAHCRALAPTWNAAYNEVGGSDSKGFSWAGVDCVTFSDFCTENSISAYPTLRVYQDGKRIHDYSISSPSQMDLVNFAKKFVELGDAAFDTQHEKAPADQVALVQADKEAEASAEVHEASQKEAKKDQHVEDEPINDTHINERPAESTTMKQSVDQPTNQPAKDQSGQDEFAKDESVKDEPVEDQTGKDQAANQPAKEETIHSKQEGAPNEAKSESPAPEPPVIKSTENVAVLKASDFGPDRNLGRWLILFTHPNCEECHTLSQKWENHNSYARSIDGINWGRVDCGAEPKLCDSEKVTSIPSLRIYQDGILYYIYEGSKDTMALRQFLVYAASNKNFQAFDPSQIDSSGSNPDINMEGASPHQEPKYLKGPAVKRPNYGTQKPKIMDVVKYTLDTLGQPIDEDPGKLIFGDSPEAHHNFRTWGAPNAPPPTVIEPGSTASRANSSVIEMSASTFDEQIRRGSEPWLVKFYSPKCPHCVYMAAAYEELAQIAKGKLNIAAVNCEIHKSLCETENVKYWPHISLYKGPTQLQRYDGKRDAASIWKYCEKVWQAQIYPIESEGELTGEIIKNLDDSKTTFIYLYDQSVMVEDWESLMNIATQIDSWGGKIYRSNSSELRELAGIKHRGTAFVNVDFHGIVGEGRMKWYDFPWSNIPKKIRDVEEVSAWAYRAKWSLLQYLDPKAQSRFSPYTAVLLTNNTSKPSSDVNIHEHHRKALELRDFYISRQIEDQDRLRIDRLRQHDSALLKHEYKHARHLMKQTIETPVRVDLAFAYISQDAWVKEYAKHLDVSKHQPGNIIIVDFFNGLYVDEFNLVPLRDDRQVLDDVVELLQRYHAKDPKTTFKSISFFKKPISGIPEPEIRPLHFISKPDQHLISRSSFALPSAVKLIAFAILAYVTFVKFIRPRLRKMSARNLY